MKDQNKWVCNSCNTRNSSKHSFCTKCGTQRPKGVQCLKCGAILAPNQNFCFNCGTQIKHDTIVDSQINISYVKEDNKHGKYLTSNRKQQNTDQANSHCIKCGRPVDGDMDVCEQCLGKTTKIWIRSIAAILVFALLSGIAIHFVRNKPVDLTDEQIKISYQNYVSLSEEVNAFESKFTGETGYVDISEVDAVLRSMADYAKQLHKKGKITDYSYHNGDSCIYMEVDGWLGVLYEPKIEGYLSGGNDIEILTMEPYADEVDTFMHYVLSGADGPDEGAELIAQNLNGFSFTRNLNNDDVTVETIRNLPDHSIILLTGHGNYTNVGPVICIGKVNDLSFTELYEDEIADGAIYVSTAGTIYITPIFVEKYMSSDSLTGSIVYFNSCYSYTDNKMADSIMRKGALAYLGNTNKVQGIYGFNAIYAFLEGLTPVATGSYCKSIQEALDYAKLSYATDWTTGSVVNICKAYDFSLPEMIALKSGTFDVRENGKLRVIGVNGEPCGNYTMYIAKASNLNEMYLENGADVTPEEVILYADETRTVNSKLPQKLNLDPGIYEIAFQQDDNLDNMVVHTFQIFEDKGNKSISVQLEFGKDVPTESPTVTPIETPTKENVLSGKCGDNLTWTLKNGVLTISGTGDMYDYDLTTFAFAPWYEYRNQITSLEIGTGITSVGNYAFLMCYNLTDIIIPGNVKRIGDDAFHGCSQSFERTLNITIKPGVEVIGSNAFFQCFTLTDIDLPDSISYIGDGAFFGCNIKSITIPANVTYIGSQVFERDGKNALEEISFTGNAPQFAVDVFAKITATAYYPANNKSWTTNVLKDYGGNITWIAEGEHLHDGNELSAYIPYVEKAMKISGYDVWEEYTHGFCSGILIDLDGDNIQELVLRYLETPEQGDAWWWEEKLSVYDYENGKVVTRLNGIHFGEFGAAGESGYVSILYKSGKPYIMTYNEAGETSGSGAIDPNRYGTMTIYDGTTCKKISSYWIDRYNNVMSYKINDKTVDENTFIGEVQQYYDAKVVRDYYALIEFPQMSVTASELLEMMK